jgi:hypothetical protein
MRQATKKIGADYSAGSIRTESRRTRAETVGECTVREETKAILLSTVWAPIIDELEREKNIGDRWLFPSPKGQVVIRTEYSDDAEKEKAFRRLNARLRKEQPPWVVCIADAYMSESPSVRPSLDPKRTEAIIFTIIEPSGTVSFTRIQEYSRHNGDIVLGAVRDIDESNATEGTCLQGRIQPWKSMTAKQQSAVINKVREIGGNELADCAEQAVRAGMHLEIVSNGDLVFSGGTVHARVRYSDWATEKTARDPVVDTTVANTVRDSYTVSGKGVRL